MDLRYLAIPRPGKRKSHFGLVLRAVGPVLTGQKGTPMTMARTWLDIDQDALAIAAAVLGTKTETETVNAALQQVGRSLTRLRAEARLDESKPRTTQMR
jgi:Arc/MetJ family transcription regulator